MDYWGGVLMFGFLAPLIEILQATVSSISNFFSTLTSSVAVYLSGYGFLPDFFRVMPSQLTGFLGGCCIVGIGVTVVTIVLKNV